MREKFIDWSPNSSTRERLAIIKKVLDDYQEDNIRLTLRQLFYQLVTKNVIPNQQKEYKKLGQLLSNARMAGIVDWTIIEDRVRTPSRSAQWRSAAAYCDPWQFRLPRWENQKFHVELWCEKDALSSVLEPITDDLHVTLMVNRGYSSSSAMYDSSKRFLVAMQDRKQAPAIIYLGDFDPSGEDMVRDIKDRLRTFEVPISITKLALNPDQVRQWRLPPNPAKMTDTRASKFVEQHGSNSYEVDAIPPRDLQRLVRMAIESFMDLDAYEKVKKEEDKIKAKIVEAVKNI